MDTPFEFAEDMSRIVYVKPVAVADLPEKVRAEAGDKELLFAVHDADGQRLALVADRRMAFLLARENDYSPVGVH